MQFNIIEANRFKDVQFVYFLPNPLLKALRDIISKKSRIFFQMKGTNK